MPQDLASIMIFAAGFGTRMGDLVKDRPKPMVEVAGQSLIKHTLALVEDAGFETKVINLHYKGQMLRDHLAGMEILFSEETPDILDTGGGLRRALPLLQADHVVTTNSDAVWHGPNPFARIRAKWDPKTMDALLLMVLPDRCHGHQGRGDFLMSDNGHLSRGPGLTYTGVQILKTSVLAEVAKTSFSLNRCWDILIERNRLFGTTYDGEWCDVGRPEGIEIAERMIGYDG